HVVDAELLGQSGSEDRCLEGTEHARLVARELFSGLVALRARPQQGVLALRELHLAKHGQHRVEDRDVAEPSRLRLAAAAAMDWITRWTRSTSTHARWSASSSRRPVPA